MAVLMQQGSRPGMASQLIIVCRSYEGGFMSRFSLYLLPLLFFSGAAQANCWGIGERTTEILRQEMRLESNNGPVTAVVSYRVHVRHEVCESGGFTAGVIDQRKCASESRGRRFIRQITVTTRDGETINLGASDKLVDGGVRVERGGPCTDHAKALTEDGFASRTGNANTWSREIQDDRTAVESSLSLIGKITDTRIVFTL